MMKERERSPEQHSAPSRHPSPRSAAIWYYFSAIFAAGDWTIAADICLFFFIIDLEIEGFMYLLKTQLCREDAVKWTRSSHKILLAIVLLKYSVYSVVNTLHPFVTGKYQFSTKFKIRDVTFIYSRPFTSNLSISISDVKFQTSLRLSIAIRYLVLKSVSKMTLPQKIL